MVKLIVEACVYVLKFIIKGDAGVWEKEEGGQEVWDIREISCDYW